MFENLTGTFGSIFDKLKGRGALKEEDINAAMREIRVALLEADVALPVAKAFIEKIRSEALGEKVLRSVTPGQQIVKIVHDVLVDTLSSEDTALNLNAAPPAVILMAGLQGSGKTTTAGKLARLLKNKQNKKVLLASLDIYRPAAQEQLEILAGQVDVGSLDIIAGQKPLEIARRALDMGRREGYDIVILDTAGRLSIDDELMNELVAVRDLAKPVETLLVADALTGQDAVTTAQNFNAAIGLTGIILTRVDGDARGGAALSMRHVTGCPVKFLGMGETMDALQVFDAERIAGRILDMGDVVSLVEKAAETIDAEEARKVARKMQKGKFDLDDFLSQLQQMKKMGGLSGLMSFMPGMGKMKNMLAGANMDDSMLKRQEAIIQSMTKKERKKPDVLNASRRKRIAAGSGTSVPDVNRLMKQFLSMQKMMKRMKKMGGANMMKQMLGGGAMDEIDEMAQNMKEQLGTDDNPLGANPFLPGGPLAGGADPFATLSKNGKKN